MSVPSRCSGLPSLDCQRHLVSPHSSCCINFFLFPPFLFCFQLSNGFSHCSLSSEPRAGPVGANLFPHCLPASRLLPRVTSVHLPDYAHYYTIGPGMFPSSHIPSWKVCVSPPSSLLSSLCLRAHPVFSLVPPRPFPFTLFLLPRNSSPEVNSHWGGPETQRAAPR